MRDALNDMWRSVATFAPKLVAFLLILIIGLIVAKLISKAVDKILERVGFDRAVERGGVKRALANSRYDASTIAGKIVYYALVLFVLQLAFGVFGPNPISVLLTGVIAFLPKLFVALIIIVVASAIAAAVRDLLSNSLSGLSYGRLLANLASIFILGLGIIAALNQIGIALTVTLPVLITILATIGGILIVGVGGGLIKPMQGRWENYLQKADEERRSLRDRGQRHDPNTPPFRTAGQSRNFSEPTGQYPAHGQPAGYAPENPQSQTYGATTQNPGTPGASY
ncbi:hypothetical protein EB72_08420 [Mycobacterium sp. SWH-M1]|nr:hypothetical protein EB72_08420 [Mycobacterium sp. SWH-M1]